MEKLLTYGNCINWKIVETEDGKHALRCASTGLTIPIETDEQGGLVVPAGKGLAFEAVDTTAA